MNAFRNNANIQQEKEKLKNLHGVKKLQYILDYYKLPIVIFCIFLYIVGYSIYGHVSHREPILYTSLININAGEDLTRQLGDGFLAHLDGERGASKSECYMYANLYLTDNEHSEYYEYAYASQMKLLSAISAEQLDVVLMNQEAFDIVSQNGYLCNLEELLRREAPDLYQSVKSQLADNTVLLEERAGDTYPMGLVLSLSPIIRQAGFSENVYLGIIGNSPRTNMAIQYLRYLMN